MRHSGLWRDLRTLPGSTESNYLHNAGHSVEIPEILFDLSQDIQRACAKGCLTLLDTYFTAHFTAWVNQLAFHMDLLTSA